MKKAILINLIVILTCFNLTAQNPTFEWTDTSFVIGAKRMVIFDFGRPNIGIRELK